MKRLSLAAGLFAASCTPALADTAPWAAAEPAPVAYQFCISLAIMSVAGVVVAWGVAQEVRERRACVTRRAPRPIHKT